MDALTQAQAALERAWSDWESGADRRVTALLAAAFEVAERALQQGQPAAAALPLTQVRRACRDAGSVNGELWTLLNLIVAMLGAAEEGAPDVDGAVAFALQASQLAASTVPEEDDPLGVAPPPFEAFAERTRMLALEAYYRREDMPLARQLANAWLSWDAQAVDGLRMRGLSDLGLLHAGGLPDEQRQALIREAEQDWRELVARTPDDASVHVNLGSVLLAGNQVGEAMQAIDRAIALAPDNPKYRDFRARVQAATNRNDDAVGELSALIRMLEEGGALSPEPPSDEERPKSRRAYERSMPLRDQLDVALFQRAQRWAELGRLREALDDLDRLERESDDATAAQALSQRARLLEASGDAEGARAARQAAVRRHPADGDLRLAAAQDAIATGEADTALQLLAPMVQHVQFAHAVVDLMQVLLARQPELTAAHALCAIAADTALRCSIAEAEYTWLLTRDPTDPFLRFSRGRMRMTASIDPREEAWNEGLDGPRIVDAIEDLALAATSGSPPDDARPLLKWLVDRLAPTAQFLPVIGHLASEDKPLGVAFPELHSLLARLDEAVTQGNSRQHGRAIPALREVKQDFLAQGWQVCAGHCDSYLADNLLRVFELQSVLDHLDRLATLQALIHSPASPVLQAKAEAQRQASFESGSSAFMLEQEYRLLYPWFSGELMMTGRLMRLDALGRLGRRSEFLAALDQMASLEAAPDANFAQGFINIAARLRDNDEPERALALADRLVPIVSDRYRAALSNLRGSLLHALQREDESIQTYREALALAEAHDPSRVRLVVANLVQLLVELDRIDEAEELSARWLASLAGLSVLDRTGWHLLRARLAQTHDRLDEAWRQILAAVRLAEGVGATLRSASQRRTWYARFEGVFHVAIVLAMRRGDAQQALALVERSRARESLDRLSSTAAALPPDVAPWVQSRDAARERRRLLLELDEDLQRYGIGYVDAARLAVLQALDPSVKLTQTSAGGRLSLSPARLDEALLAANADIERLTQRIEDAALAAQSDALGRVLEPAQIGALLND